MNPTREQMELAAKAAGYELSWLWGEALIHVNDASISWNPLNNGDDSQRLQVKLRMTVSVGYNLAIAASDTTQNICKTFNPAIPDDDLRAMREAIFLVAMEIGRAMK